MRVLWSELRSRELKQLAAQNAVVLVPVGAMEQHGPHLPVGVDALIVNEISRQVCEAVHDKMAAIYLPAVWMGYSPHHIDFAGTVTLETETFLQLIRDVCRSIWCQGFRRIILLNGHGKNRDLLGVAVAELKHRPGISVVHFNYWNLVMNYLKEWRVSNVGGINHAGEMETALMLHLYQDLVHMADAKQQPIASTSPYLSRDLMVSGAVRLERKVAELSTSGTVGDPTVATSDRGKDLFQRIVAAISRFLIEFDAWPE